MQLQFIFQNLTSTIPIQMILLVGILHLTYKNEHVMFSHYWINIPTFMIRNTTPT